MNTKHPGPSRRLKLLRRSFFRKIFGDQSGQILPFVAVGIMVTLGAGGLTIDVGHAYLVRAQLQDSSNAAALAAAGVVYDNTSTLNPTSYADTYSSQAVGDDNFMTALGAVTTTVTPKCLNMLMPAGGTSCTSGAANNAVQVTQTTTVPTFFMKLFGRPTLTVSATATASMQGNGQPWNVAIILDSTGSMSSVDANCGNGVTQFACATTGIEMMLGGANPCAAGYTTCATTNANLSVALFSFPGITTSTVADDITNCSATPSFMLYSLPPTNATSYSPATYKISSTTWTSTYEIVPFSSDYYSATASNHLNTSSNLVKAVSGCMNPIAAANSQTGGLAGAPSNTNGGITYYAAAIYAAQSALIAQQAAHPGSQNAIILLSDGQANMPAAAADFPSERSATLASGSTGYATLGANGAGVYPDVVDQCQQAIVAAQTAATAGTRVYAVAYGSESAGCSYTTGTSGPSGSFGTDTTTIATGKNATFTAATITPCLTMENIASSLNYFYSDYNQSNAGSSVDAKCIDSSHPVSSLNSIFLAILSGLTKPRLLPNNAT
jgi:hypothetical protein